MSKGVLDYDIVKESSDSSHCFKCLRIQLDALKREQRASAH